MSRGVPEYYAVSCVYLGTATMRGNPRVKRLNSAFLVADTSLQSPFSIYP